MSTRLLQNIKSNYKHTSTTPVEVEFLIERVLRLLVQLNNGKIEMEQQTKSVKKMKILSGWIVCT